MVRLRNNISIVTSSILIHFLVVRISISCIEITNYRSSLRISIMEEKENEAERKVETLDRNSIIARNLWGGLEGGVTIPPREEAASLSGSEASIDSGRKEASGGEEADTPPEEDKAELLGGEEDKVELSGGEEAAALPGKGEIAQTQSQQELTVEELFQQIREKEIKILLKAEFPDNNSNGQSYTKEKTTANGKEESKLLNYEDSAESHTRPKYMYLCFPCCNSNRAQNEEREEKIPSRLAENMTKDNEACSLSCEMDQEDSVESLTGAMYLCFPCFYRNRTHRKKEKAAERTGLFARFRKFFSSTVQRMRQ